MKEEHHRATVSACIICKNEELHIRRCLESLKWCDEIVVLDSGSSDQTLSICREYTDRVYHQDWLGFGRQRQVALEKCKSDWVLFIDADEEVSDDLRDSILSVLSGPHEGVISAYECSRIVYFLGRWWNKGGWFPEYRLRFGRRGTVNWDDSAVHERMVVAGPVGRLKGALYHFTYRDLTDQVSVLNRYSSLSVSRGPSYRANQIQLLGNMVINPIVRFLKFYFLKRGFRDGMAGFIVAVNEAYYVFLKYAKVWEAMFTRGNLDGPGISQIDEGIKEDVV